MQQLVSLNHLEEFADEFWKAMEGIKVFAFHGEMGAGKTTLIGALCRHKGVLDAIGSPTFSIINKYSFGDGGAENTIFHIDLYRLNNEQEIIAAGVEDCIYSGSTCFVEWPEKAPALFDDTAAHIFITITSDTTRSLNISSPASSIEEQS